MKEEKSENLINVEQMEIDDSQNDKIFIENKKKYIFHGILSLISTIIHTCGNYSVFLLRHTMIYLISFRKNYNPNLTIAHGYFALPIMSFILALSIPAGGMIEKKIGSKKTIVLSTLIICLSFSVMYFSRNLYVDYVLMGIIGFGMAIGLKLPKRNACSYFMNKKALISGSITLIASFISAGVSYFYEKYILNPYSESPTIEGTYYEERIYLNFQKLIIVEIVYMILTSAISLVLFYKNDTNETIKFGFGEKQMEKKEKKIVKKKIDENKKLKLKKALFSIRTIRLFFMLLTFFPIIHFINNTWRPIGIYYKVKTYHLQLIGSLLSIVHCFSAILFSLVGDQIQFKKLFCCFSLFLSIISFIFPLSFNNSLLFIFGILVVGFTHKGFNIIIDPYVMKVFGMENFVEIIGVIRSSSGIAEIASIIFAFYLENYFTGNKDFTYKFMYLISGFSSLISFILGLFESDSKFNYEI